VILLAGLYAVISAQPDISITAIPDKKTYNPADTVTIALQVAIPDRFHLYSNPLGSGIGKPLMIRVTQGRGVEWLFGRKTPAAEFTPPIGGWVWAHKHEATFYVTGIITSKTEKTITDTIIFDGLICDNSCIPVVKKIPFSVSISTKTNKASSFATDQMLQKIFAITEEMNIVKTGPPDETGAKTGGHVSGINLQMLPEEKTPAWDYEPREKKYELNLLLAVLLAFLAGIILNVMPCVLPVLGVKILSFSQGAGSDRKIVLLRSLVFAAGVFSIFMVLASFAAFAELSWGQQFQNPKVLAGIVCIIFVFALGMFDVFMIVVPSSIASLEKAGANKGYTDDFIKGMFTTILATPCSGPFLGATLAWTLLQPPAIIYIVFAAIGAGMAFPYIVFSSSQKLLKLIPRPGPWMEDFKRFMGFLLMGFAVYLMIGLPKEIILQTTGLCVLLAFSVTVYTRFCPFGSPFKRKLIAGSAVLIIIGLGSHGIFNLMQPLIVDEKRIAENREESGWTEFSVKKLTDAHAEGRHVMIDFTANWCMNCQFNKMTVYQSKEVKSLIAKKNILALKADLTKENRAAESLMHHLGSRSVPFCAIFPGDDPYHPVIMRDIVSKRAVQKALKELTDTREP